MQQDTQKSVFEANGLKLKYEPNRISLQNKARKMMGEITFPAIDSNTVEIDHSYVDPSLRGQGIAAKLVEVTVDYLRKEGKKAVPTCSYVKMRFDQNPDYQSIMPKK